MYDQENNDPPASSSESSPGKTKASTSTSPATTHQAEAVMLHCAYCRKEFDRATTKAMPFCSSRCKQIDLGLWLNEVHGMPYEIDPGIS